MASIATTHSPYAVHMQPAPPLKLTHGHHTTTMHPLTHPRISQPPHTTHMQSTYTPWPPWPPPSTFSSPPCSRPQPHAHPHDFTSTMQPWSFTKPTQLTHVATPHHNSLTLPTQITHAAHNSPMHTSPTCSPYTSQLTHGLLTTTMHSRPPLRSPYNWPLAAEFFYGELWNLWLLVNEIQMEKMLIPSWKSMELE